MRKFTLGLTALVALAGSAPAQRPVAPSIPDAADRTDPLLRPIAPQQAAKWLAPQTPVRMFGQSYYVGFKGLGLVLVRTSAGLILFDGGVPQSVRAVQANIRRLGFDPAAIRYIFVTEPHWDHAGGVAALARDSGATVVAGVSAVPELELGMVGGDDPQAKLFEPMPPVARVRGARDGQTFRLGETIVTAHATPGHTAGSTSWSWRSCERGRCATLVFVASVNPVSADDYRFVDHPDRVAMLRRGTAKLSGLRCDIAIPTHPDTNGTPERLDALARAPGRDPLFVPGACRALAATFAGRLDDRLAKERAARP